MLRPTRQFGALLPWPVGPWKSRDDVQHLQDAASRRSITIDNQAAACTALPAATFQSWRLTGYVPAQQYAQQEVPSSLNQPALNTMWEQGIAMLQTLDGWVKTLKSDGCAIQVPAGKAGGPWGDIIAASKFVVGGIGLAVAGVLAIKIADIVKEAE